MKSLRKLLAVPVIALLGLSISQCSKAPTPESSATAAAPATQPTTASSQPKPASAASDEAEPASGDAIPLLSAALTEGRDYVFIPNGAPLQPQAGKVEVVELFNYACPACNSFEPKLAAWKRTLPDYVHLTYAALDFRPDFVPYARAFYAADQLGLVEKTHEAVYDAIHQLHTLPGEGAPADEAVIAKFYANYGADAQEFQKLMGSFGVNAKIAAGRQFAARSQVTGTPSLVIDGKYLVKGESFDTVLQNATQLIAKARQP